MLNRDQKKAIALWGLTPIPAFLFLYCIGFTKTFISIEAFMFLFRVFFALTYLRLFSKGKLDLSEFIDFYLVYGTFAPLAVLWGISLSCRGLLDIAPLSFFK